MTLESVSHSNRFRGSSCPFSRLLNLSRSPTPLQRGEARAMDRSLIASDARPRQDNGSDSRREGCANYRRSAQYTAARRLDQVSVEKSESPESEQKTLAMLYPRNREATGNCLSALCLVCSNLWARKSHSGPIIHQQAAKLEPSVHLFACWLDRLHHDPVE